MAIGPLAGGVIGYVKGLALAKVPQAAAPVFTTAMTMLIDSGIAGVPGFPGAKRVAGHHLERRGGVADAVDSVVRTHLVLAAAQGVVTNIGGVVSMVLGVPANVAGIIIVQARMVACVAHLHGYDVDDPRVRTAIAMCLLGEKELDRQIGDQRLPSTPLAVATSPAHTPELYGRVANRVFARIVADAAGKGIVVTLGRRIPVLGGSIAGVADYLDTAAVSRCARTRLVLRRPAPDLVRLTAAV